MLLALLSGDGYVIVSESATGSISSKAASHAEPAASLGGATGALAPSYSTTTHSHLQHAQPHHSHHPPGLLALGPAATAASPRASGVAAAPQPRGYNQRAIGASAQRAAGAAAGGGAGAAAAPRITRSLPEPAAAAAPAAAGAAEALLLRSPLQASGRRDPTDPSPRSGSLSWDDYFMALAFLSAERSKDPNKQVGAVIVNAEHVILGIGYNGFPRGCCDSDLPWAKLCPRGSGNGLTAGLTAGPLTANGMYDINDNDPLGTKYPYVVHAEANALLNKNAASVAGARVYVTMFPCNECAKLLIQAGVREVVYHEDKVQHLEHLAAAWPSAATSAASTASAASSSAAAAACNRRGGGGAAQPAGAAAGPLAPTRTRSAGQAQREARLLQAPAPTTSTSTTTTTSSSTGPGEDGAPSPAATAATAGSPCPVTPGVPLPLSLPASPDGGSAADAGGCGSSSSSSGSGGMAGGGGDGDGGGGEREGSIGGAIAASPSCSTGWRAHAGTPPPPASERTTPVGAATPAAAGPAGAKVEEVGGEGAGGGGGVVAPWSGFWPSRNEQQNQQQGDGEEGEEGEEAMERRQQAQVGGDGLFAATGGAASSGQILSSWARGGPGSGSADPAADPAAATAAAAAAAEAVAAPAGGAAGYSHSGVRVAALPSDADVCYLASLRLLRLAGVALRQHRLARPITVPGGC
ncbi:hypothetical protein HXX76_014282 [Chlamydomonas incerta]|uniref:dCMP deaminase n=1 Tax=Chlamydomonas incerta TaxID=51695 RepID=A0A835VTG9_CHLIN|nr:hypothetical protein HXX76_014282 [Chlamydomonas incerta]|eukprot:KAG2424706.1 hypothetical protein HXX76_014282 [Chlamydomonas incerta]